MSPGKYTVSKKSGKEHVFFAGGGRARATLTLWPGPRQVSWASLLRDWVSRIPRRAFLCFGATCGVALLLTLFPGCNRKAAPPVAQIFEQIRLKFLRGDLAVAQLEADKAYRRYSGHDQEWAWKFRLLEADILANQGLNQELLALLDAPLPPALASGPLGVRKDMLQALAYAHLGQFPQADLHLQEAWRWCQPTQCEVMGELARMAGAVEIYRGNIEQAEVYYRQSLDLARQQQDSFLELSDLLNLGVVEIGKEHFDESIDWSNGALRVSRTIRSELDEEKALGNLGWAHYKLGDFDRALDFYLAATRKSRELGAVIDEVEWLNNQGLVYFQTNRPGQAREFYTQSLELARKSQNKVQTIAALTALALAAVETGQFDQAKQYSDEAFNLAHGDGDRPDELYALVVQGRIAAHAGETKQAEERFQEVARDPKSDTSLRWEAQDDLATLYESQHRAVEAERQYRQSRDTLEAARSSLRREEFKLPFMANAVHLYDDYVHFLVEQGKTGQALQVADYSRAQTLAEGLGLLKETRAAAAESAQEIARTAQGTILFYWLGVEHSYLWAANSRETRLFPLAPAAEIEDAVQRYRKALLGPRDVLESGNEDGRRLYEILIAPAASLIMPHSRVVIIPDGNLNTLNFETLVAPGPPAHYWIEDATIVDASSLRLLSDWRAAAQRRGAARLLLIGDPIAPGPDYPNLANAALEMDNVGKHFAPPARTIYARQAATASAYLGARPEQAGYVHFVAHGTASQLNPLDSAIVLSGTPTTGQSFKLYARDIIRHPLQADLVTISACYGQGVRAYTGEGLVGLSWAFLRAGARNVIGALWEVSDVSTPQLMDQMYSEIAKGRSPDEALRLAKLTLLHSDGVFRKPFYWAPFQVYVGK